MGIEEYLDKLTEQIRCQKARIAVRKEIRGHLEDQAKFYLETGFDEKEAEERSVLEMGDPVAVGGELNRIHRPKMAWKTVAAVVFLGTAGLLIQYFLQRCFPDALFTEINFGRQFFYLILSFAVMLAVCWLDYTWIGRHAGAIYLMMVVFLLLISGSLGVSVNGAERWIPVPLGFYINMTTAVLLSVPLYGAILYSWRGQGYVALAKALLWTFPALAVAIKGDSVYTTVLLFLAFAIVLAVSVWKGWFAFPRGRGLLLVFGGAVFIPAAGIWFGIHYGADYVAERLQFSVLTALGPVDSISYLTEMQKKMLENSKWVGAAYGQPQDWMTSVSDYTLTYTIAYYGILAGIFVVGVLALLFLLFYRRSIRQRNQMGMLMGVGCSVVLLLQLVLYVAENLALIRPCGSYCPFLTYGGNGMLATFALLGLMLSIYRYEDVFPEEEKAEKYVRGNEKSCI